MTKKTDTMAADAFNYVQKMAELETVITELQSDDVALDRALKLHDAGKKLVSELESYLDQAEVIVRSHTASDDVS